MKDVEKKDAPEIPGGVQAPYPGGTDVGPPSGPRLPGWDDYPPAPQSPFLS
ncbi:MAG: hypothetical protein JWO88_3639 [Frankiales bacterium]|nr:hypothetical protein [Frankiales bacterium]